MFEQTTKDWAEELLAKVEKKTETTLSRIGDGIPYIAKDKRYNDFAEGYISWWTNSFFTGLLWQLYHYTDKEIFRENAEVREVRMDKGFEEFTGLHHDVGFMWLHSAVANFRKTQNMQSRKRGLHAATILAGRYNVDGEFIIAWNGEVTGWVIIDSMMNIPLLYWASRELNDPRFEKIARKHADTVMKNLIRSDGSSGHIASFNPETGAFIEQIAGQGYHANSAWSRGNAWAIYGFALSYHHTKDEKYLNIAKRVANWFIAQVSQTDFIPLLDFTAPATPVYWDTSAGLIATCGMLEIAEHVNEREQAHYRDAALNILRATEKKYANWDTDVDGIIYGGNEAYNRVEKDGVHLVYSDYFFTEALLRLAEKDFFLW